MSRAMEKMESSSMQRSQNSEQLSKIDETLRVLITTLTSQSERIKKIEEAQVSLMLALTSKTSTSEASEADSLTNDINAIKKTLNEQSEMLSELGETVSDKRVLKLSDGSTVTQSDLQAHSMMKRITEQMTTLTSTSEKLAEEVHAKSRVLDDEKAKAWLKSVGSWIAKKVNEHFDQAVQEPVDGLKSDLEGFRKEMGTLGAERLSEVRKEVDETVSKAHKAVAEGISKLDEASRKLEGIERRVTFVGISRLALAVLPLFASLLLVGGLVWGLGSMFGIGPLFGWAWASFSATSAWWAKGLIAAATLGGAALFIWVVLRVSRWVYEELR